MSDESDNDTDSSVNTSPARSIIESDFEIEEETDFRPVTYSQSDSNGSQVDLYKLLTRVHTVMKKVREGVKLMRNINAITEYMSGFMKPLVDGRKPRGLLSDMPIRWNSSFMLMDRLMLNRDVVRNVFSLPNALDGLTAKQKTKLHELTLSQDEWEMLGALRQVLEPFYVSTIVLSSRHYPTMASAFYVSKLLSCFLKSTHETPLVVALKQSLFHWFSYHCVDNLPPMQSDTMKV